MTHTAGSGVEADVGHRQSSLGLFIPLRLATYVILMAVLVGWLRAPGYLELPTIAYSLLTLALAVTMAMERRFGLHRAVRSLTLFQFLLEIVVVSGVVYSTGNVQSSFSALYVLVIVSAALRYRLVGTLIIASVVSGAYVTIIWLGFGGGMEGLSFQALQTIFTGEDAAFYSIFLHLLIFYLVAFISGYLAERLKLESQTLADTSRALHRARLETDDILRHLNSGLLTIDRDGYVVYFNRAAERILGYREQQVRGMHCRDVFGGRMPVLATVLMEALTDGVTHPRKEIEISTADGGRVPLGLATSLLTEEGGRVRGVIAIFSDLTEAKRLEEKVRAADRLAAIGELSASIAHEIRNPLAAISGSVEVLRRELHLKGDEARLMDVIVRESNHLDKILTDFLMYARIDRPAYHRVELCRIIGDIIDVLRHHRTCRPDHRIEWAPRDTVTYVTGDEDLIRQLLLNLAINACEAIGEQPGTVSFTLHDDPETDAVIVRVADTGPGIPDDVRERIFEPFFSTKTKGTGLGLAIVQRICATLGLGIEVSSGPEGTVFTLRFPRTATDPTAAVAAVVETAP